MPNHSNDSRQTGKPDSASLNAPQSESGPDSTVAFVLPEELAESTRDVSSDKTQPGGSDGSARHVLDDTMQISEHPDGAFGLTPDPGAGDRNLSSLHDPFAVSPQILVDNTPTELLFIAPQPGAEATPALALSPRLSSEQPDRLSSGSVSNVWFILLASYASLVTIVLLWLILFGNKQSNPLESLPDVAADDPGQLTFVPVDAPLPTGHVLRLGEQRRFGNIVVEPVRVTREPIEFTHYSKDQSKTRAGTGSVWKLWLKLSNASRDQAIIPLDRNLLLRWVTNRKTNTTYTNQFLYSPGDTKLDDAVMVYRLPLASEWDMADQQLGLTLAPGESFQTYVASEETGLEGLADDVRWRLQFRKGQSSNGGGVTTVIDIAFTRQDVQDAAG